jgi:sigma-54-interacting transcriptional regulator
MDTTPTVYAGAAHVNGSLDCDSPLSNDFQIARSARVNLLLIQQDAAVAQLLDQLLPDLNEPIARWHPGQRLELPPIHLAGTMVLQNVGAMCADDQRLLLAWLEASEGRTQVVSTTPESLLPSVNAGTFLDTLYYRLNTVCVNGSTPVC